MNDMRTSKTLSGCSSSSQGCSAEVLGAESRLIFGLGIGFQSCMVGALSCEWQYVRYGVSSRVQRSTHPLLRQKYSSLYRYGSCRNALYTRSCSCSNDKGCSQLSRALFRPSASFSSLRGLVQAARNVSGRMVLLYYCLSTWRVCCRGDWLTISEIDLIRPIIYAGNKGWTWKGEAAFLRRAWEQRR